MQVPDLKAIADEIKAIFEKHDIGGFFTLHEAHLKGDMMAGNSEYVYMLETSYSAITFEEDGFVRVKAKAAELGGPEKRDQIIAATDNLLMHINRNLSEAVRNTRKLQAKLTDATGGHNVVE